MIVRCLMLLAVLGFAASVSIPAAQAADEYYADDHTVSDDHVLACDGCDTACDDGCDVSCGCDGGCDLGCDGCGTGCCGCGFGLPCKSGDAISLWDRIMGCHDSCINVGGWVQVGYTTYDTGMFNNHPDTVDLNQAWGFIEKEADGSCGFDWGFRFDYVYGTDGPDTQAFGNPPDTWDLGWDHGNFYGHAIPQAYVDLAYGDFSLKVGHFYTIAGYEVVTAPDNFFYSHAFTMYYAEPFTHTGALATYSMNDDVELYGGWTGGWDTGFERNGGDNWLGGFSVALTEDVTLIYTNTFGKFGFNTNATGYSHSIVLDVTLTEKLNYVFQTDYVDYNGTIRGLERFELTAHRYGVNNYLFYDINDCLAAGLRFEWFNAEQYSVTPNIASGNNNYRSDLYALTFGVNYKPHPNFRIRPEIRWNKDDDGFTISPEDADEVGFGMDMILTF